MNFSIISPIRSTTCHFIAGNRFFLSDKTISARIVSFFGCLLYDNRFPYFSPSLRRVTFSLSAFFTTVSFSPCGFFTPSRFPGCLLYDIRFKRCAVFSCLELHAFQLLQCLMDVIRVSREFLLHIGYITFIVLPQCRLFHEDTQLGLTSTWP